MRRKRARFAQLLGIGPTGDDRLTFLAEAAQAWQERGELAEAATIYDGLIVLTPNDPLGPLGSAEISLQQGDFGAAERSVRRAIHAPNIDRQTMAYAYKLHSRALLGLGRAPEAARSLQLVCALDPDGLGAELVQTWAQWKTLRRSTASEARAATAQMTPI